jgi:peptidoglycan/xylan/chitin deacetylase (PgdA/CDA1 family)
MDYSIMKIPGKKTAIQIKHWLSSRLQTRGLILGYHRVAKTEVDGFDICVSPEHFSEQMAFVRRNYHPISLNEMVSGLISGSLPHKSIAVTFDDGYADNLYAAEPILERFEIPAAVFISPGNLGKPFWWNELESIILSTPRLPGYLLLPVGGDMIEWEGGDRKTFLDHLYRILLQKNSEVRNQVLTILKNITGWHSGDQQECRSLTAKEIQTLTKDGLVDVGAHTMNHPILTHLSIDQQHEEIYSSKVSLEKILGRPIEGFAYPNGIYSPKTTALVKEVGFRYACSSRRDVVLRKGDRFQLPRFWPGDWNEERLSGDLRVWLG